LFASAEIWHSNAVRRAVADSHGRRSGHLEETEPAGATTSDDPNCVRARASNDEWSRYYERADRARARHGDPFRVMVERAETRRRLGNVAATGVLFALLTLVGFSLWSLLT
jgi:hypothetical protein